VAKEDAQPASVLVESGLLLYLLSLPFGQHFADLARSLMLVVMMVGLAWLRLVPSQRRRRLPFRMTAPMLAFVVSAAVSTIFSSDPRFSLEAARFFPVALLFFFAAQEVACSPKAIQRLCAASAIVIVLLSADCLYQFWSGQSALAGSRRYGGRITGSVPHPNDLGVIPLLLPLAFLWIDRLRPWTLRGLGMLMLPLAVAALVLSQSRNAWLGLATGLGGWLLLTRRWRLALAIAAAGSVVFIVAWWMDLAHVRARLATLGRLGAEGRIGIWLAAWEMFKDAPIVGKGPHVFAQHYFEYLARVDLPEGYRPDVAYIPWAHNMYLEMLAERGVIGFLAFNSVLAGAGVRVAKVYREAAAGLRTFAIAVAISFAVFLVMSVFDLTFLKDWVSLVFWLLAGLAARLPDLMDGSAVPRPGPEAAPAPSTPPTP